MSQGTSINHLGVEEIEKKNSKALLHRGGNYKFFLHVLRTSAEKNYLSEELSTFPLGKFGCFFFYIF